MTQSTHKKQPLSIDDIDEILKPVIQIRLDNLEPGALEHLVDQLGLIAHVAALRIKDEKNTNDDHRWV